MKKLTGMLLISNSLLFVTSAMAAEYCFQDDYIVRAQTGDQITSGMMSPAELAKERIGFPYNAQLTHIRITPPSQAKFKTESKSEINPASNPQVKQSKANNSSTNQSQKLATIIPEPIDIKAFQGVKVNIQISQNPNCEPCTAQKTGVTESNDGQLINLELCSKLPLKEIQADLVFTRE